MVTYFGNLLGHVRHAKSKHIRRDIFEVNEVSDTQEDCSITFHPDNGGSLTFIQSERRSSWPRPPWLRGKVVERVTINGLCTWIIYDGKTHQGTNHTLHVGFDMKPNFEEILSFKILT